MTDLETLSRMVRRGCQDSEEIYKRLSCASQLKDIPDTPDVFSCMICKLTNVNGILVSKVYECCTGVILH